MDAIETKKRSAYPIHYEGRTLESISEELSDRRYDGMRNYYVMLTGIPRGILDTHIRDDEPSYSFAIHNNSRLALVSFTPTLCEGDEVHTLLKAASEIPLTIKIKAILDSSSEPRKLYFSATEIQINDFVFRDRAS